MQGWKTMTDEQVIGVDETPTMPEHFDEARETASLPPLVDPIVNQWCGFQGPHLTDKERRLLELLGAFVLDRDIGMARVTQETLARLLGVDVRTIRNLTNSLRAFGFIEIEPVPAANGYEQYIYTLTGVYSGWAITRSAVKMSREDVYQLQQEKALAESRLAEVLAALAVHDPEAAEIFSANGSSSKDTSSTTDDHYRKNYFSGTPQEAERVKPAPAVDEEADEIEAALQDRWHILGPTWNGGYPAALNWYTQKRKCRGRRGRTCETCTNERPDAEHPHREEFWHQWRAAEFEAAKPPGEENTVTDRGDADDEDLRVCEWCFNGVKAEELNDEGKCVDCVNRDRVIEEELRS